MNITNVKLHVDTANILIDWHPIFHFLIVITIICIFGEQNLKNTAESTNVSRVSVSLTISQLLILTLPFFLLSKLPFLDKSISSGNFTGKFSLGINELYRLCHKHRYWTTPISLS